MKLRFLYGLELKINLDLLSHGIQRKICFGMMHIMRASMTK